MMGTELDLERINASFPSRYWRWEIEESQVGPGCIEEELARRLPHIDPRSWPERFRLGGVYRAGMLARIGEILTPPCRLEYYEPYSPLELVHGVYPAWRSEYVLYTDPDLAVVVKPAGLPSTAPRDQQLYHLQGYLEQHFQTKVHLPSRLDVGVTGVLLVSLSSRMNRYLQRAYDGRKVEKYYLCEVQGEVKWSEYFCTTPVERDPRHAVLRRCAEQGSERAESAETRFAKIAEIQGPERVATLLRASPLTGRTHQIRVHCQHLGLPIVGDPYYAGVQAAELRLMSFRVGMFHPYRGEHLSWSMPRQAQPDWLTRFSSVETL